MYSDYQEIKKRSSLGIKSFVQSRSHAICISLKTSIIPISISVLSYHIYLAIHNSCSLAVDQLEDIVVNIVATSPIRIQLEYLAVLHRALLCINLCNVVSQM